jgi:hypothetical protein
MIHLAPKTPQKEQRRLPRGGISPPEICKARTVPFDDPGLCHSMALLHDLILALNGLLMIFISNIVKM